MKTALILVDLQNDFCSGGKLAVREGEQTIELINQLQEQYSVIVATQDWHPANHKSFASNNVNTKIGDMIQLGKTMQRMWPDHCVQGTIGAEFHQKLNKTKIVKVFKKGTNKEIDSYSGFFDNDLLSSTGMGEYLKELGMTHVVIVGLALDYCVKATAIDAKIKFGFDTTVILEATRAVNIAQGDDEAAIKEMRELGIVCK